MKNIIIIVVTVVLLIVLLIFASNYINNETIKNLNNTNSGEVVTIISGEEKIELKQNIIADENEFEEKVLKNSKKVLVDFYADWCGPCQIMSPILDEFANEHEEIDYYKVNVDDNDALSTKYRVLYIPTLIVFESGEVKNSSTGVIETSQLEELIK